MKRSNFSLLEVLCAIVILSLSVSALLWQLSLAVSRLESNITAWEQTHDLTQAAEFLLIHGSAAPLDPAVLSGDYQVSYFYTESELSLEKFPLSRRSLKKLSIQLFRDGLMVDELNLDTFVDEGGHAK